MSEVNLNIDDLKKLSNAIEVQQKNQASVESPQIKKVAFAPTQPVPAPLSIPITRLPITTSLSQNTNIMTVCNVKLPKSTVYFTSVLIVIGILIWFISKKKSKREENKIENKN